MWKKIGSLFPRIFQKPNLNVIQKYLRVPSKVTDEAKEKQDGKLPKVGLAFTEQNILYQESNGPFKLYMLTEGPKIFVDLTVEEARRYYIQMQTIRRLENASATLYRQKIIRGFCHLYTGQEAVAVGIKSALRDCDSVITAYRCHGWTYLMGISPKGILTELTGRCSGCVRGKGGSMHMYSDNFYGGNGIVGAQVPLGAGIALASKYNDAGGVCITCYGDGAANQGQVFESFALAHTLKLPVIYICENNKFGMGTSTERSSFNSNFYTRGDYIPGIWVDGMNIMAVRSATEFAIKYAVNEGPIILEMNTYRYSGHSMSDPGTSYRSRQEVDDVRKKKDPISCFKILCLRNGLISVPDFEKIDAKINEEIEEAIEAAKYDPEVEVNELTADVYAANLEPHIRSSGGFKCRHFNVGEQKQSNSQD